VPHAPPIPAPGDRPLRGAMVGAGNIAPFHLRAWQSVPGVEICGLADRDLKRACDLGAEFGIASEHVQASLEELLDREKPDFVDIATPPSAHVDHVLAAAARGVHVFCQKPFAPSLDEALRMIDACAIANVRCVVNENWRWRRWYREVKRLIDERAIGTPNYARFTWHADDALPGPDGSPAMLVQRQPYTAHLPRLMLFEWGIHLIDTLRFLFGDVRHVTARMRRVSPVVKGEDGAVVLLEFDSDVLGMIDISWGTPVPAERRFERGMVEPFCVEGTEGCVELDPFLDDALFVTGADRRRVRSDARGGLSRAEAYQECFNATHRHFAERLRGGRVAENEAIDNWNTLAAVFAAYDSAELGRRIEVPQRPE
jgi:D-apiose dehydrogenase